jgi:aspartate aminotransferase
MFASLAEPEADPIIRLMQQFRDDPRADKIDLGVGVYRDEQGHTPVMRAVKAAEARLLEVQDTKQYVGLAGDPAFLSAMRRLLLGGAVTDGRVAGVATPGGTGAIRQLLELVRMANPEAAVWISRPSWPNHAAIVHALGMPLREYRYFDAATGAVDVAGMRADLAAAAPGDVVLLHACCHNPSGADLSLEDWAETAALIERGGLVPFVDMAYQGFGDGVDMDAAGLRHLAARVPEMLVAASGSKSFGLYRERVGTALAICATEKHAGRVGASLASLNRQNFAFPPDHGARVAGMILDDARLRADWQEELEGMRRRIVDNRDALAAALRAETNGTRFDFLVRHRGMFSLLGLAPDRVERLRTENGIYLVGDSRVNLAGLADATIPLVARALARALAD